MLLYRVSQRQFAKIRAAVKVEENPSDVNHIVAAIDFDSALRDLQFHT